MMCCIVSMYAERMSLEFLTQNEVEMTSAVCAYTLYLVETVCPVDTQKTNHGQEDTCTHTYGLLHVKGIEFADAAPTVTALSKDEAEHIGAGSQHEGVAEFHREACIGVTHVAGRCDRTVVVTSQTDGLGGVER